MKAIKDIEVVKIGHRGDEEWWWEVPNHRTFGVDFWLSGIAYKFKQSAINNWKKFAVLNGIKNCKIITE